MGEYAGASNNPEVIAPLDKLKSLLGTGGGRVDVTVRGSLYGGDLRLLGARTGNSFERKYGRRGK